MKNPAASFVIMPTISFGRKNQNSHQQRDGYYQQQHDKGAISEIEISQFLGGKLAHHNGVHSAQNNNANARQH